MKKRDTQDYLRLLVKEYDHMKHKVDPESLDGNRFLHFFHEAMVECGHNVAGKGQIYSFNRALDPKSLIDEIDPKRRIMDTFYIVEEPPKKDSGVRMRLIVADLIDALESAGWTEEKIREHLNSIESNLTGGDPRKKLTPYEDIFLFGELIGDESAVDFSEEIGCEAKSISDAKS